MSGIKNIVFRDSPGQPLEVDVCAVPGWEGFDKLVQFLKNEYKIEVVKCIDGPDARRWILKAEGKEFELRHDDPYGNSLVAIAPESKSVVKKIGLDLENRLRHL